MNAYAVSVWFSRPRPSQIWRFKPKKNSECLGKFREHLKDVFSVGSKLAQKYLKDVSQ